MSMRVLSFVCAVLSRSDELKRLKIRSKKILLSKKKNETKCNKNVSVI